jgi:nanoRNase/pAp phosphatase (c-di-AMP/oligoRNAs hydrolase)
MRESLHKYSRDIDELLDWISGRGKIIIVVHDNPDPDCLASAMALNHLFVMKLNKESTITFSGIIGRSENIAMARELQIPLTPLGIVNLKDYQTVCMLDTQPETGNNSLPKGTRVDVVLDHHPLRDQSRSCRWVDVREDYGATATILYEYLLSQHVSISVKLATALFYAIKSETQDLGREAGPADREAYLRLFPLTSKKLLFEITHPKLPVEYYLTIGRTIENASVYGTLLFADIGQVIFPEIVAEMADFFLRLEKIETVLCMGIYSGEMIISLRTVRHDQNTGEIIKKVVSGLGKAGGHGMMAGGKIEKEEIFSCGLQNIEPILKSRLLKALGIRKRKPLKLVSHL